MAGFDKTTIANLALAHLGTARVNDVDDSDDPGARDIRDQWMLARQDSLSAYEWGFASRIKALAQNGTTPVTEWQYSYDKPDDWIRTNAVSDDTTFDRSNPFRNWWDRGGTIETDATTLYLDYVYDHTTVGAWPVWFVDYMAAQLAFRVNPKVTTSKSHGEALAEVQKMALMKAKARDAQMQPIQKPPRGNWYRAMRGGWNGRSY